jgi:hypothetical protein
MPTNLPPPIVAYLHAANARDAEAVAACFADDAVVIDERREMRGIAAIRAWRDQTFKQYRVTVDVVGAEHAAERTIVTARVAGNFSGSPVELRYAFRLAGGKIAALEIRQ